MSRTGRTTAPLIGSEQEVLLGYLGHHRDILRWKTEGLDGDQLATRLAPSTMTLGGLLKHMALVEDSWFTRVYGRQRLPEPWASVDWKADPDWEWHSAAGDSPEELLRQYDESVARSSAAVGADADFETVVPAHHRDPRGQFSLRWIVVHMVEEYARHNGHADLIRESIDGQVGDAPPTA